MTEPKCKIRFPFDRGNKFLILRPKFLVTGTYKLDGGGRSKKLEVGVTNLNVVTQKILLEKDEHGPHGAGIKRWIVLCQVDPPQKTVESELTVTVTDNQNASSTDKVKFKVIGERELPAKFVFNFDYPPEDHPLDDYEKSYFVAYGETSAVLASIPTISRQGASSPADDYDPQGSVVDNIWWAEFADLRGDLGSGGLQHTLSVDNGSPHPRTIYV